MSYFFYGEPYENVILRVIKLKPAQWVESTSSLKRDFTNTIDNRRINRFLYWKKGTLKTVTYRDLKRKINIFLMKNRTDRLHYPSAFEIECFKDSNILFHEWEIKVEKIETEIISTVNINEDFITKRVIPYNFCTSKEEMMGVINKYIPDEYIIDKFNSVEWLPGMYFEIYLDSSYKGRLSLSEYLLWKNKGCSI